MSAAQVHGYEDAPATKLLAVNCACCGRALLDAVSVETGVGPDCRKRHGYDEAQGPTDWEEARAIFQRVPGADPEPERFFSGWGENPRAVANRVVYDIACEQDGEGVVHLVNALRALGFITLAERIAERLARVVVLREPNGYALKAPYSEETTARLRRVGGRRWDRERKVNTFPERARAELWQALRELFPGQVASGPNGLFTIGGLQ